MKLVKEHIIFEKFTEDSDPIKDLGIGLIEVWKNLKKGDILRFKRQLQMHGISHKIYPEGGYFVVVDVDKYSRKNIYDSRIFSYDYYKNKEKLLTSSPDENHHTWSFDYNFFEKYLELVNKNELKESLNEKFTEDSDPIEDMGIGVKVVLKNSLKKTFELGKRDAQKLYVFSHVQNHVQNKYHHLSTSSIREIMISDNTLAIGIYSNIYYDKNKNPIDKKIYTKELLEESGLYIFIKRFIKLCHFSLPEKGYDVYEVRYLIKPEYGKYFINKTYNGEQDIK